MKMDSFFNILKIKFEWCGLIYLRSIMQALLYLSLFLCMMLAFRDYIGLIYVPLLASLLGGYLDLRHQDYLDTWVPESLS